MSISVSVGVCTYPNQDIHADELLQNADVAMYRAKAQGRNDFRVFKPEMVSDLHRVGHRLSRA